MTGDWENGEQTDRKPIAGSSKTPCPPRSADQDPAFGSSTPRKCWSAERR
jgi:hypothetical protein